MVPHRQLYSVSFTKDLAVAAVRSGVVSGFRLLYKNIPYVLTSKYLERMLETDPKATYVEVGPRPVTAETQRLLVFFPGGIGDVLSLKPVLEDFKEARPDVELAVASTIADECLIGDVVTLWDYPVTEIVANHYDAWVNIAEMDRASVGQELQVSFANYIGIAPPERLPRLIPDTGLVAGMAGYIRDWKRPAIGIHMNSACHFRSIPHSLGLFTAFALIDKGCDVYLLGGADDNIILSHNGELADPPEHLFDMTKTLLSLEYYMAFLTHLDVLVSPDTGPMHLGGALGVPTLGIFGMTDGSKRTSYYPSVQYIQGEADCGPCELIQMDPPCTGKWCKAILSIGPEVLADRVMQQYYESRKCLL